MQNQINQILKEAQTAVTESQDLIHLDHIRTQFLGKKGQLTELLKTVGSLPPSQRSTVGQLVNIAKQSLTALFEEKGCTLKKASLQLRLQQESVDITLPGRSLHGEGGLHPITRISDRIQKLFTSIGFTLVEGREIEDDYHNFEALNFPLNHPARAMQDTFYFEHGLLLRTHTSPVQIRTLKNSSLPLRIITPGRVYRCESDQTHTPMFHQIEGLVVDEHCTFADLKGLLQDFLTQLFERDLKFRFRPSFFPFTEPSAEVDISCVICESQGCRVCKGTGWLEVLGCGMVHPNVLSMCNIDSERYSGFAFGVGMDRIAMLRYEIDDLRKFFESDLKFLEQF